jgi:uncharacterized protein YggE
MLRSKRSLLAVICIFCAPAILPAQPEPLRRTISVTGEAEVKVVPDEAVFNFGIETDSKDIEEARRQNDARVKDLLDLAARLGIERQHVQTDYLSIEPRYDRDGSDRKNEFLGYFVRRNVVITLKDLGKFEQLLSEALKLGVNFVDQAQFRTTELRRHRDQARQMAIRAAKEKAVALAGELNMKVGKPISISEASIWENNWYRGRAMTQNAMAEAPASSDIGSSTIAPGQISISARISVVFELE